MHIENSTKAQVPLSLCLNIALNEGCLESTAVEILKSPAPQGDKYFRYLLQNPPKCSRPVHGTQPQASIYVEEEKQAGLFKRKSSF